jgi:hypothetical protein
MIMSHSNPQSEITAFDDFKRLTPLFSSTRNRTLKNLCDEMDSQNEPGFRYIRSDNGTDAYELTTLPDTGLLPCL